MESQETSPESPIQKSPSRLNRGISVCVSEDQPYASSGSTGKLVGKVPGDDSVSFAPQVEAASDRMIPAEGCCRSNQVSMTEIQAQVIQDGLPSF